MDNKQVRSWRPQVWIMMMLVTSTITCIIYPIITHYICLILKYTLYVCYYGSISILCILLYWAVSCGIATIVTGKSMMDLFLLKPLDECENEPSGNYDDDYYP